MGRRYKVLLIIITLIFLILMARTFYLQLIDGKKLSDTATIQRMANTGIEKNRGNIFDKNLIPFTNRKDKLSLVLMPLLLRGKEQEVKKVCDILGLDHSSLIKEIDNKKEPVFIEVADGKRDEIQTLSIQGISFLKSLQRYDYSSKAKHLLGYLNKKDQFGDAGLEKKYQEILDSGESGFIGVITDARNNLLKGLGYRLIRPGSTKEQLNVKLTLDYKIQKIVEDTMDKMNIKGAVVVEDVATGDILAMTSKPDYDQNDVSSYLDNSAHPLFNRAVASYNLGSIFKIIDAAVIYENKMYQDHEFICNGYINVGDREYKCTSYERGGHGKLGIEDAFAYSCNPYFIKVGINAGGKKLIDMAKSFGMGVPTGVGNSGIPESNGLVPNEKDIKSYGNIANISIGQGDVMATPLQVADIVATVANGGIKNKINIVDSIVDDNGNKVKGIREDEGNRIISKETADRIKHLMEEVTQRGSGTKAGMEGLGGSGGKTGSAETGQLIDGRKIIHAWFAGYFPKNDPRYSISVFVEDGKSGGDSAAPVFAEIAKEMLAKGF